MGCCSPWAVATATRTLIRTTGQRSSRRHLKFYFTTVFSVFKSHFNKHLNTVPLERQIFSICAWSEIPQSFKSTRSEQTKCDAAKTAWFSSRIRGDSGLQNEPTGWSLIHLPARLKPTECGEWILRRRQAAQEVNRRSQAPNEGSQATAAYSAVQPGTSAWAFFFYVSVLCRITLSALFSCLLNSSAALSPPPLAC